MEDKAKLRGWIAVLAVCVVVVAGLLVYLLARTPQAPMVVTAAPIAPLAATKYVWDGKWRTTLIPAGVGSMSVTEDIESGTTPQLEAATRDEYDFQCMRQVQGGYEETPCTKSADHHFRLVNKTDHAVEVRWHPG